MKEKKIECPDCLEIFPLSNYTPGYDRDYLWDNIEKTEISFTEGSLCPLCGRDWSFDQNDIEGEEKNFSIFRLNGNVYKEEIIN